MNDSANSKDKNTSNLSQNIFEIIYVKDKKVFCQGDKHSGNQKHLDQDLEKSFEYFQHPINYLNMGKNDFVVCPYCSRYFTIREKNSQNSVIIGLKNQILTEEKND
jgi:uncharacterized Zn-finger protein